MTITEVRAPIEPATPPPTQGGLRSDLRALRTTLLVVGVIVVGAVIAIVVGVALYAPAHPLTVTATDYRIQMPPVMRAGTYKISFVNHGAQPHELLVFRTTLPAGALPIDAAGNVVEDSPRLHGVLDSGNGLASNGTQSLKVRLTPGHYAVVCNLPTHYRFGMWRDLTVRKE
jgi:uncharacterized cupredoxin-like copper-binding protein